MAAANFTCSLCNSNTIDVIYSIDQYPLWGGPAIPPEQIHLLTYATLTLGICTTCGFIMLLAPPPGETTSILYDGFYSSSNPVAHDPNIVTDTRMLQLLEFMEPILATKPANVLEIGAYDGQFLYQLRRHGCSVYGCEPNPLGQQAAQRYQLDIKQDYFGPDLYPSDFFDVVVSRFVLEHVPQPRPFLAAAYNVLHLGGYLVCDLPNGEERVCQRILGSIVPEHVSYFGPRTLTQLFALTGFTNIDFFQYPGGIIIKARKGDQPSTPQNVFYDCFSPDLSSVLNNVGHYQTDIMTNMMGLQQLIGNSVVNQKLAIYGANTQTIDFLRLEGVKEDQITYIIDDDPYKQGCCLLGTSLPIFNFDKLISDPVDAVLISAFFSQEKMTRRVKELPIPPPIIIQYYPFPTLVKDV